MQPQLKREPAWTLASFLDAAGIAQIPHWARQVTTPFEPRPDQIDTLNSYACNLRWGDWSDPGVGKTFPLQAHLAWLCSLGNRCVVATQTTLVAQFERAFRHNFQGVEKHISIEIYQGTTKQRQKLLDRWNAEGWPDILIMSYAMFRMPDNRAPKPPEIIKDSTVPLEQRKEIALAHRAKVQEWMKVANDPDTLKGFCYATLMNQGYTFLAVDEAVLAGLCKPSTRMYKSVEDFLSDENGLALLTGTPVNNTLSDAYGLIEMTSPGWYGSFRNFEATHIVYGIGGEIEKYVNTAHMYRGLYAHGKRVLKKDIMRDMPARTISEIPVTLAPAHRALYKQLVDERMLELPDGSIVDATTASALRQRMQQMIPCPEEYGYTGENALFNTLDDLLQSIGDHKVVIYAWFRSTIDKLERHLAHLNPAVVNGDVVGPARDRQVRKFAEDPTCRVVIANPKSGGVGIDGWQHVCSYCVFFEVTPIPGIFQQAIDRLHRGGQKEPVTAYILVVLSTIVTKLRNSLIRKETEANVIVQDKKTLLADLMGAEGLQGELQ